MTGGNAAAVAGVAGSGLLIFHSVSELATDVHAMSTACGSGGTSNDCLKRVAEVGMDLLELAAGAASLMNNMQTDSDTKASSDTPGSSTGDDGFESGGSTEGTSSSRSNSIKSGCVSNPYCKIDPETQQPILGLPSLDTIRKATIASFGGNPVAPDGRTLEDALNSLDDSYRQAEQAVAAFNDASLAGKFDVWGGELADLGQGHGDQGSGLGLDRAVASGTSKLDSGDSLNFPTGDSLNLDALINKEKKARGGPKNAKANGLDLENAKTGRLMTLFERVSRALRGTRDRDLVLAKVEWSRKQIFKRNLGSKKEPDVAVKAEKN